MAARHDSVPLPRIPTLDTILDAYSAALGGDFEGYRNHAYRVANLCVGQSSGSTEDLEKIAIAAAFHDLGIWTDRTFDYLVPSGRLAQAHLDQAGRGEWIPDVTQMIRSVMPGGMVNGVGLLLLTMGTANCIKADQMGAAPVRPVVLTMGV